MPRPEPKEPQNVHPPQNAWGQCRSKLAQAGVSQAEIEEILGDNRQGKYRHEMVAALIERFF